MRQGGCSLVQRHNLHADMRAHPMLSHPCWEAQPTALRRDESGGSCAQDGAIGREHTELEHSSLQRAVINHISHLDWTRIDPENCAHHPSNCQGD